MAPKTFKEVVKWNSQDTGESVLHIWSNKETDTSRLAETVQAGRWNELADMEGVFAGVYKKQAQVYLFCDRLGIYPLCYSTSKNGIYVSPSIPELSKTGQLSLAPSKEGIVSMFLFGHHLADETVFEGIKRCNGGETLVIDTNGEIEKKILWKRKHIYESEGSIHPNELGEIWAQAVKKQISNHKVLVPLSGGFDSRAVLGAVLECVDSDRVSTTTFGGTDTLDFRIGRLIANKTKLENTTFPITSAHFEDDFLRQRACDYGFGYATLATQPPEMLSYLNRKCASDNIIAWGTGGDAITGSHIYKSDISLDIPKSFEGMGRLLLERRASVPLAVACKLIKIDEDEIVQIVSDLVGRSLLDEYERGWQFLDAWDIFVRGRMELISVLPFNERSWISPHFSQKYFNLMSTQCFQNKIHQSIYKDMLASRYKSLFSLPSKRLNGRSLVCCQGRDLFWALRCYLSKVNRCICKLMRHGFDSVGRNYGKNVQFFNSNEGQRRLNHSVDTLLQQDILRQNPKSILEMIPSRVQIDHMLITLGYAFDR